MAFGDLRGFESEQTVGVRGRFVNLDANSYEGSQAFPRRLLPETLKPRLVYRLSIFGADTVQRASAAAVLSLGAAERVSVKLWIQQAERSLQYGAQQQHIRPAGWRNAV